MNSYRDRRGELLGGGDFRVQDMGFRVSVPFTVLVRSDDGLTTRHEVIAGSRYLAAAAAVDELRVHQRRRGTAVVVLMDFDPREPLGIGEELQGRADFNVLVERAKIRRTVTVRAASRAEAIDLAMRVSPGSRPVFAQVRYVGLGTCAACGVNLFADLKIRETPRGRKCADCW